MRKTIIIVAALLAVPGVLLAQQQSTDGPYILHEYFTELRTSGGEGGTAEPVGANQVFGPGQPPALSLEARPGEPIYSKDGPVFDQPIQEPYGPLTPYSGANTLDERTDRVNSLTYFANFDPSIIPYKRVVSQNHAVRKANGDYSLEVTTGERTPVELGEAPADAETFWGTFLLRLEPNRLHPIASVAPDQQILQIVTEPDIALDIEKDDADNYFVKARRGGLVRLNLEIAVPPGYFAGDYPDAEWSDFPTGEVPPMSGQLRAHALSVARGLGFNRSAQPREVLLEMVRYFRNFDARPFPDELRGGDRLQTIAENGIGVCRHRSLAFVFIAQALGIPSRYVYNEAHAFVEVFWPGNGWRRIDLGGAADELNASANQGRRTHDPGADGLPEPERYLEEQDRMARNGWDDPNAARRGDGDGGDGGDGGDAAEGDGGAEGQNEAAASNAEPGDPGGENVAEVPGENGATEGEVPAELTESAEPPPGTPPPTDNRAEARLTLLEATAVVRRGSALRLRARLTSNAGRPLDGRTVDVYIGPVGSAEPTSALRLGTARTNRLGELSTSVEIPKEHAIGRWSLFLVFGGDEEFRSAIAE